MGARADIERALYAERDGAAGTVLVLGQSAARAFLADLYHDGFLPVPEDDADRKLPPKYKDIPIETTEEFDGWTLEKR